jgi:hypothetical protein
MSFLTILPSAPSSLRHAARISPAQVSGGAARTRTADGTTAGSGATTRWGGRRVASGCGAALAAHDCDGEAGVAQQQDGEGGGPPLCFATVDWGERGDRARATRGGRRVGEEAS